MSYYEMQRNGFRLIPPVCCTEFIVTPGRYRKGTKEIVVYPGEVYREATYEKVEDLQGELLERLCDGLLELGLPFRSTPPPTPKRSHKT